ncbi:MAG: hypothetical protein ABJA70_22685 [Chryseolinea sp.]
MTCTLLLVETNLPAWVDLVVASFLMSSLVFSVQWVSVRKEPGKLRDAQVKQAEFTKNVIIVGAILLALVLGLNIIVIS